VNRGNRRKQGGNREEETGTPISRDNWIEIIE
jgi:hypothetical protein